MSPGVRGNNCKPRPRLVARRALAHVPGMCFWLTIAAGLFLSLGARANAVDELIGIHTAVMGGAERINAHAAIKATGMVTMSGKRVHFTMVAAWPNRVRLETEGGGRSLVQAYDGVEPPWEFDTGTWPPKYRRVADGPARRIVADAEFDGPPIAGAARGYTLDYAGEAEAEGRKYRRLLVTHKLVQSFALYLDPETYLIQFRSESHTSAGGRPVNIVTRYSQFQSVDGVLLPQAVTTLVDGKVTQEMVIERIEPNLLLRPDTFSMPKGITVPQPAAK